MAAPLILAAMIRGGEKGGVRNYIEAVKVETQMLVSALGKYDVREVSREDVASLNQDLARMFGIPYVYSRE